MRLVADQLTRSFGPRRVFGPLSFAVETGRVLGIAGSNGSGKTTLLKTLAGLLRPTSGLVWLEEGKTRTAPRDMPWALGWAAPDLVLYAELTPRENLAFFARVAGGDASPEAIDRQLAAVGLDPERQGALETRALSTGQRQRLKLAFATLHAPAVLLLDEPAGNLDEAGRAIVMKVVAEQRRRGATVIASNDPRDLALADESVSL